ncbi:hypothetical protein MP228_002046 [Amoeboaphelidium protococcarum]|nr:hypothetical protein MP228_002046 [Amoeboaphelidium protococcarum]
MSSPKYHHWNEVKGVFQYLRSTVDLCIQFRRSAEVPQYDGVNVQWFEVFSDSDFAQDTYDRKSIAGSVFKNFGGAVNRWSKKFPTVAKSTIDAEYNALSNCTREALLFSRHFIYEIFCGWFVQGRVLKTLNQFGTFLVTKWCEVKGVTSQKANGALQQKGNYPQVNCVKVWSCQFICEVQYQTQAYVEDLYYILQVSLKADWLTKQLKVANPHIGQTSIEDWCTFRQRDYQR